MLRSIGGAGFARVECPYPEDETGLLGVTRERKASHLSPPVRLHNVTESRIVVVGGGFAGLWAALGAAAVLDRTRGDRKARVEIVSPDDALVVKPRLHETDLRGVRVPFDRLLPQVGVVHRRAAVVGIDTERRRLALSGPYPGEMRYDQLVFCAGGATPLPASAPGVHRVDSYERAVALREEALSPGRRPLGGFAAIVVGAGFTGIEVAAELADTLGGGRQAGHGPAICLVERGPLLAPGFGSRARTAIEDALASLGIELRTAAAVSRVDGRGATLRDGERLDARLVVWAGGTRANPLARGLGIPLDGLGRIPVGADLATPVDGVWAAGDCAGAKVDGTRAAPMSCQHAIPQGRVAGRNAAAALLGLRPARYSQPLYLTCLDLGPAGALLTSGFERDSIVAAGAKGKRFKRFVNRSLIYPPAGGAAGELLALGRARTPGRAAAIMQGMALRSNAIRNIVTSHSEDRARQFSTP